MGAEMGVGSGLGEDSSVDIFGVTFLRGTQR